MGTLHLLRTRWRPSPAPSPMSKVTNEHLRQKEGWEALAASKERPRPAGLWGHSWLPPPFHASGPWHCGSALALLCDFGQQAGSQVQPRGSRSPRVVGLPAAPLPACHRPCRAMSPCPAVGGSREADPHLQADQAPPVFRGDSSGLSPSRCRWTLGLSCLDPFRSRRRAGSGKAGFWSGVCGGLSPGTRRALPYRGLGFPSI